VSASVGIVVALLYRAGLIEPPPEIVAEIEDTHADDDMSAAERAARRTVRRWRRWRMRRRALAAAKTHASKVMPEPEDRN
jgi:hypothetical protein